MSKAVKKNLSSDEFCLLIGGKLKNRRKQKGLSQTVLAETVGVSRNTIERIENGRVSTTTFSLYKICCVLNTTLKTLLKGL